VLLNYDQHWLNSEPGPISGQDCSSKSAARDGSRARSKLVVGREYAYDWSEAPKQSNEPAAEFSVQEALLHAYESEEQVEFDQTALNPHYSYSDEHDQRTRFGSWTASPRTTN